ncbi:penicillin-binding protein 1C [Serratia plymuthica]|uniref:Penicillin-binding protein 1C n=1 Tax=Serratia plymuthica TaxID=82996 RepID=A0A2X4UXL5_SERPL|nr:penicillin-binding protein 1C [Serratia plymuthica]
MGWAADGTPVAGQFGFATAVPLLNQVNNLLLTSLRQRGQGIPTDPRPASVSRAEICWPGGQPLAVGDSNCRQRRLSWILDGTLPPTLSAPGQESALGSQPLVWLNARGLRVAADCPGGCGASFGAVANAAGAVVAAGGTPCPTFAGRRSAVPAFATARGAAAADAGHTRRRDTASPAG